MSQEGRSLRTGLARSRGDSRIRLWAPVDLGSLRAIENPKPWTGETKLGGLVFMFNSRMGCLLALMTVMPTDLAVAVAAHVWHHATISVTTL